MNPIEMLMAEHRIIETVLDALGVDGELAISGGILDPDRLSEYVEFFRGYADAIHHGKEEAALFAALRRQGCPQEFGAVLAAMARDHDIGRNLVDDLASAGRLDPARQSERSERIGRAAANLVSLLRRHILDEDEYVFPETWEHLSKPTRELVSRACDRFEMEHADERRTLESLAERLSRPG